MKRISALILFLTVIQQTFSQNLLSGKYKSTGIASLLIKQKDWMPFPKTSDRVTWKKANQEFMKANYDKAISLVEYKWPSIPATTSLQIVRTGDRDEYQNISFKKREVLGTLLIAEIYENEGRFVDAIVNGVWSICEESFWGVSAHLPKSYQISGLVDVTEPFVDLFSAETATYLSWVDYFLGDKLDAVSPQITKRIYYEINRRVLTPLMDKPHAFMTANANGRRPNNWNPWICSNWLNTVLLLEKDEEKRVLAVSKILSVLDNFLNPYPQDGGCDEGPGYWHAAAASLYDNLSLLNLATNDSFSYCYQDSKIKNMAAFVYKAQISETYFINFADASPKPNMDGSVIYRFGKSINDPNMMMFGASYYKGGKETLSKFQFFRNFFELFITEELNHAIKGLPLPKSVWLPDTEVMLARDKNGSTAGWTVAAKGGHNDESHNHNDIGNYIVYHDGLPLLIDVGSGTYTGRTFSSERYDIWFNTSDYHNLPTINGFQQRNGANFKASLVDFKESKSKVQFSLDISNSYPKEADINSWNRLVTLNRDKGVIVKDTYDLKSAEGIVNHLMTCYPAEVKEPGKILISYQSKENIKKSFIISYNPLTVKAEVEKVKLGLVEDRGVIGNWGDNIYRINFTQLVLSEKGEMVISVEEI